MMTQQTGRNLIILVDGPNLTRILRLSLAGVAQLVEHHLAKVDVESSSLFARSNSEPSRKLGGSVIFGVFIRAPKNRSRWNHRTSIAGRFCNQTLPVASADGGRPAPSGVPLGVFHLTACASVCSMSTSASKSSHECRRRSASPGVFALPSHAEIPREPRSRPSVGYRFREANR
jgi:hypothetical protein